MNWKKILDEALNSPLPGEDVHMEMAPMSRMKSSEALKQARSYRESAVALHLWEKGAELFVLLTQRNVYPGTHSGQISFPGGKHESYDVDFEATARRESWEEIAMPLDAGELLGQLTDVYIPVSQFLIHPFVFYHQLADWKLQANPREVADWFWYPMKELLDDNTRLYKDIEVGPNFTLKNTPYFSYKDHVIWGATSFMLNELRHAVKIALSKCPQP